MIPNLAIHMNREINSGYNYNAQKDLLPLYGCGSPKGTFMEQIAEAAKKKAEQDAKAAEKKAKQEEAKAKLKQDLGQVKDDVNTLKGAFAN